MAKKFKFKSKPASNKKIAKKLIKKKLIKKHIKKLITKFRGKISHIKKISTSKMRSNIKKEESEIREKISPKQFEVITPDGVDIKLNLYDYPDSEKGVILLPMLGKTKESMDYLAQFLYNLGYKSVAVDYRGHGGSELNWQSFRSKDFVNMVYDVKAARDFLLAHKVKKIAIIGASIGANIALNHTATDSQIRTSILLSPGIDYRGVKIDYSIPDIKVPILVFTSKKDQYSFVSTQHLQKLCSSPNIKIECLEGEGHGMELVTNKETKKQVLTGIQDWLAQFI